MAAGPFVAEIAALIGDPARANMLALLMDGRAYTATELANAAGVSPQTASGHLAKLSDGRLLTVVPQGRHRYFRLASPLVATALEALAAVDGAPRHRPRTSCDVELREARTCYDHLAGRVAVQITAALLRDGHLVAHPGHFDLTDDGKIFFKQRLGIDIDALSKHKRALTRNCLDWSERRPHLGGALGAMLASVAIKQGWLVRSPRSRALTMTRRGEAALAEIFGITKDSAIAA
jgi:DNA-binding transcriptional ArsR family regulator